MEIEKELNKNMDIEEVHPILELYRKDVLEKYIECEIILIHDFKEQGKNIDDVLEHLKTTLWHMKNKRAEKIKNELGL